MFRGGGRIGQGNRCGNFYGGDPDIDSGDGGAGEGASGDYESSECAVSEGESGEFICDHDFGNRGHGDGSDGLWARGAQSAHFNTGGREGAL